MTNKTHLSVLLFLVFSLYEVGLSQIKASTDTSAVSLEKRIEQLQKDASAVKDWQSNQMELTNLANQRISDNLAQTERLFSYTSAGISIFGFIIAVMNVILFVWIFLVQRNLKQETKEINADTKKSRQELDEKINEKSEELTRKTIELYNKMLDSKYGQYDKKLRDEIMHGEEDLPFDRLNIFEKKLFRAEKELDEDNVRDSITHFTTLLTENNHRDYIFNKIGIAYTKIGVLQKALEYFEKAYNETETNKHKYVLNLLEQYIIQNQTDKARELIDVCESLKLNEDSLPVLNTLKFTFYVKTNNNSELKKMKETLGSINWDQPSNWEFKRLKELFKPEFANDYYQIYRFSNVLSTNL